MTTQDKKQFIPPKNKNDMTAALARALKKKRVNVFIDSANLYYASSVAGLRIDYYKLARWYQTKCNLINLNFYTAYDPDDQRQLDFFNELGKVGYNVIKKPIQKFENSVKGNMDIELAVDSIIYAGEYDILVLISGDGDFKYLIQTLDKMGKEVIVLGVGGFTSYELHKEATNYFFLNRISEVWQKDSLRKKISNNSKHARIIPEEKSLDNYFSFLSEKPIAPDTLKANKQPSVKLKVSKSQPSIHTE